MRTALLDKRHNFIWIKSCVGIMKTLISLSLSIIKGCFSLTKLDNCCVLLLKNTHTTTHICWVRLENNVEIHPLLLYADLDAGCFAFQHDILQLYSLLLHTFVVLAFRIRKTVRAKRMHSIQPPPMPCAFSKGR